MEGPFESAAAGIGASFGTGSVSPALAAGLRTLFPGALFLRASLRCGAGLLVTDDLLQPGQNELSVVSLKNSLAGLAMAQQQTVVVAASAATATPAAAQVVCLPVALPPRDASAAAAQAAVFAAARAESGGSSPAASGMQTAAEAADGRSVYVGALMLGSPHPGSLPAELAHALQALADAAAPYLLLLSLTKAADMADLLKLRAADCFCCGGEEDELQDLPLEVCRPQLSPSSSGGLAGGTASLFTSSVDSDDGSQVMELDEAALNAAAAKALAGASSLAPPRAAQAGALEGSCRGQHVTAALPHISKQQQAKQAAVEGEADPKAALRQLQAAGGSEAGAPLHVPAGPLLHFADYELEARFTAAHNRAHVRGDALFCILHLASAVTLTALAPDVFACSGAAKALTLALALPLLALAVDSGRYLHRRETVLSLVLLLQTWLLRSATAGALASLLPAGTLARLPWLLRSTGAEALAMLTIGFRLRLRQFLKIHILCLALLIGNLPARCGALATEGCVSAGMHRAAVVTLLSLGGLLPAVALYKTEAQARRRFLAAAAPLFGVPHQPGTAAAE